MRAEFQAEAASLFNLLDIFLKAQNGQALGNFARQFGLTPDQTGAAIAAMMPAFAAALQRQMADPQLMATWFGYMLGQKPDPYRDAMAAFSPAAQKAGLEALDKLFGSNEASRAMVEQIERVTGVGRNVLDAMMPAVAATLMGGLGSALADSPFAAFGKLFAQGDRGSKEIADFTAQLIRAGGASPKMFADMMEKVMASLPRPTGETETFEEMLKRMPNPAGPASAFDETFGEFIRGFNRGRPAKAPEPDLGDMIGRMFQAGAEAQASQVQAFGEILDRFWGKRA